MVKINYDVLEIDHIVEFSLDSTIFAAARENGSGHLRIFLIYQSTGNVYTRNGRIDSWEQLFGSERNTVIARVLAARNHQIPTYRANAANGSELN
jgi:hypothetical protein